MALRSRGIRDRNVLGAMERVPRELFAPRRFADLARTDVALPLPCGQTMSAPKTVAAMLVALEARRGQHVIEIGTGSGYVTALLAQLGCRVRTVERYAALAEEAAGRFAVAGLAAAITSDIGDAMTAPLPGGAFDRVLVNGFAAEIPAGLVALVAPGGRLVGAETGDGFPRLVRIDRAMDGTLATERGGPLRISPLAL
jgi:protein-L-isoaspartate(D-aspartate) O-methyltransferase